TVWFAAFCCFLSVAGVSGQTRDAGKAKATGMAAVASKPADVEKVRELIVQKSNDFRDQEGRSRLTVSPKLAEAAAYFAAYMAQTNQFGHDADGNRPSGRAKKFGYDYCLVAENIAYLRSSRGFTTARLADRFVEGWNKSPGHRKNLLDPDQTEIGIGVAQSKD